MTLEIKMPALSPTMEEGTLAKWLVREGDAVRAGDLIAEIETDKATMEFESVEDGVIGQIVVAEGTDEVKVGTIIALFASPDGADIARPVAATPEPEALSQPAESAPVSPEAGHQPPVANVIGFLTPSAVKASPLARRIAAAKGIDLELIVGTGSGGRVMRADLGLAPMVLEPLPSPAIPPSAPAFEAEPAAGVPHEIVRLSSMRRTIARRLTQSKQSVPHFYLTVDCRLDALLKLRAEINAELDGDTRLSVNDMMIKALALALEAVPDTNVQFAGDDLISYHRVDIAMAVAIEGGLVTPVIADAANKRLSTIARESKALALKAREGRLQPQDYQGGTASISNLGMFGVRQIVPVINPPQAVILGLGAGEPRPHVIDGEIGVATILTATASFDHRAIDGAMGAELIATFRSLVERPVRLLA